MTIGLQDAVGPALHLPAGSLHESLDAAAQAIATTLPAGSSAGGEQPKFLAMLAGGQHVIVKFTPALGSPGGQRWADLLQAEQLASATLQEAGHPVADAQIVRTEYAPFEPDAAAQASRAAPLAQRFWERVAHSDAISSQLRAVAAVMGERVRSA